MFYGVCAIKIDMDSWNKIILTKTSPSLDTGSCDGLVYIGSLDKWTNKALYFQLQG